MFCGARYPFLGLQMKQNMTNVRAAHKVRRGAGAVIFDAADHTARSPALSSFVCVSDDQHLISAAKNAVASIASQSCLFAAGHSEGKIFAD